MSRGATLGVCAWMLCLLAGCTHIVVDPDGTRHMTGFMVLTLPPSRVDASADAVRMRTVGVAVSSGHVAGTHIAVGYSDVTIAAMRRDSVVTAGALRHALGDAPLAQKD